MKTKKMKSLNLRKMTISNLNNGEMGKVKGGESWWGTHCGEECASTTTKLCEPTNDKQ